MQFINGSTYNYGYVGSRATGDKSGKYLVVGSDWKGEKPEGIDAIFTWGTPFSLVVFRTQLFNPADMPKVVNIQKGYIVQPLSTYLN